MFLHMQEITTTKELAPNHLRTYSVVLAVAVLIVHWKGAKDVGIPNQNHQTRNEILIMRWVAEASYLIHRNVVVWARRLHDESWHAVWMYIYRTATVIHRTEAATIIKDNTWENFSLRSVDVRPDSLAILRSAAKCVKNICNVWGNPVNPERTTGRESAEK